MATKEFEAFFHLRNHVRDVMRSQTRQTEEMLQSPGSGP
jgi:hypothetical protein